ncbi:MAG: DUF4105 domain-containing protein [Patescibacteria group bacterium]|nr:DUF4105 domain-containing protein [Patescibacteria group bacterium]
MKLKKFFKIFFLILLVVILILSVYVWLQKPSNVRDWNDDQKVLSYFERDNNLITVYNIRNINYRSVSDFDVDYYDKTFDLEKIKTVDYIVEPFADWRGLAHTFLSFGFENEKGEMDYIAISVEIRKEKGESFSPWKGLLDQFELMYVVADENDVIKLRTNYRKDEMYLYPIDTYLEKKQLLFVDMLERANHLKNNPEFYNTIWSTCTTNILDHINKIRQDKISKWDYRIFFPGYSDKIAYDVELLDTDLSFEEARKKFQINSLAEAWQEGESFSEVIRQNLK